MTAVTTRRTATRGLAAAGLLAAALGVTACGAGQISQTATQVAAVNGNQAEVGQISLRNVRVDYPRDPNANATLADNKQGGRAVLLFTLVNNSPDKVDTLTGITTDVGQVHFTRAAGDDTAGGPQLPPQQTLVADRGPSEAPVQDTTDATPQALNPPIYVEIDNLTRNLTPGVPVDVTFNFRNNGSVDLNVPVDAAGAPRLTSPRSPGDHDTQGQN